MIASEIPKTLIQFVDKENPYHCILIDGSWGIGKSYQINKALKKIHPSAMVSLFGANSIDEVLLQLAIQICDGAKASENHKVKNKNVPINALFKLPTIIGEVDLGPISAFGQLFSHTVTPKTVIDRVFSTYNGESPFLIVFDDLERINDNNICLDDLLGTVETLLLKRKNIKVLFIANLEQLPPNSKTIWDKYSEKLINRTYYVDELSESIEFFPNQADNNMALSFMRQHGSNNLRTLQKANNFYADILYRLKTDAGQLCQDEGFLKSLRLACYAVVFELTEKIYELKYQQWENEKKDEDSYHNIAYKAFNRDEHSRICYNYLSFDSLASKFVSSLIEYLKKGYFVTADFVSVYYEYISHDKPTYYKSDEEVLKYIEKLRINLLGRQYKGIPYLVRKADSAFIWCEVMQVDADDIEKLLCDELPNEYKKLLEEKGKPDFLVSSVLLDDVQSDRTKTLIRNFAQQEIIIYENFLVSQVQSALTQNDYSKVLHLMDDISSVLRNKQNRHEIEKAEAFAHLLCSEQLLPIGSISEIQYYCCKDAYKLAMTYFHETYQQFIQEQEEKHKASKMFCDRMKNIQQNYNTPESE